MHIFYLYLYVAATPENLTSGFPNKSYQNQPVQLQRLARKFEFPLYVTLH